MDSRKWGIKGLSKAGCYYILFGAIWGAVFAFISLFVKFDNIVRHDLLTTLCFISSIVLFAGFYIAISQFEDPAKMVLTFHPPKAIHREEILRICEEIYAGFYKRQMLACTLAYPLSLGLILFGIARIALDPSYFLYNLKTVFVNAVVFPVVSAAVIAFVLCRIIYRNRIDEIRDGAFAVAEVNFVEKYYCIASGTKTSTETRTSYFVILEDSHGNKGRFKVNASQYYKFRADNTILLIKRSKGKLFYNTMEPVVILLPERYNPDM